MTLIPSNGLTYQSCGKKLYFSKKQAKRIIKTINQKNSDDQLQDAYYCPRCDAWHVTSLSKKRVRKINRYGLRTSGSGYAHQAKRNKSHDR